MWSRSELEALIVRGLQELRKLEARLDRRWAHLGGASVEARNRFPEPDRARKQSGANREVDRHAG